MENRYSMGNEELQEEDVWGVLKQRTESEDPKFTTNSFTRHSSFVTRRLPTATRTIPKSNKSSNSQQLKIFQHSAPVNIPDWSKIYGKNTDNSSRSWLDPESDDDGHVSRFARRNSRESDEEEEQEEEGGGGNEQNMIPPHEWIARSRVSSFSMCEGAGRTLKGRDLSRVRNAVLIKTGFLES